MDATPLGLPGISNTLVIATQGSENPGLRDTMPLALEGMQDRMGPGGVLPHHSCVSLPHPVFPHSRSGTASHHGCVSLPHPVFPHLRSGTTSHHGCVSLPHPVFPHSRAGSTSNHARVSSPQTGPLQGQAQRACVIEPRVGTTLGLAGPHRHASR